MKFEPSILGGKNHPYFWKHPYPWVDELLSYYKYMRHMTYRYTWSRNPSKLHEGLGLAITKELVAQGVRGAQL